jgi:hypothetical protein
LRPGAGCSRALARNVAPLVTATRQFFPPSETTGHARAEHVFDCTRRLVGMADWPCTLQALPERPKTRVAELGHVKIDKGHMPYGTFSRDGNGALITYDSDSLEKPALLVGTLAHELAHYLLHSVADGPPGGEQLEEFATDLTTVYLGFGLFGANQAFNFSQHRDVYSQGWSTSGLGYLRERDWAFALAVFCALRGEATAALKPWLKAYLYTDVQAAARYVAKTPRILERIGQDRVFYLAENQI